MAYFLFPHQMIPLHLAAESGQIKIVNYLVDQKEADINVPADNGVTIQSCDDTCYLIEFDLASFPGR